MSVNDGGPEHRTINLKCPKCGKVVLGVERADYDPPKAVTMQTQCPECVCGDFSFVEYFDKDGKQVFQETRRERLG